MEPLNIFSFVCMMFGLACAPFALTLDHLERRRLNQAAAIRRFEFLDPVSLRELDKLRKLIYQEDGKPLCYISDEEL